MKKIIIKILVLTFLISFFTVNAETANNGENKWATVTVTEKIPWLECSCADPEDDKECEKSIYTCTVEPWFWSVIKMIWSIIKYFTFLVWLWWVLFIIYNWIMYSMWWAEQSLKEESKKRIIQTLIWLVVLFLSWLILNLVAPWIYVVK